MIQFCYCTLKSKKFTTLNFVMRKKVILSKTFLRYTSERNPGRHKNSEITSQNLEWPGNWLCGARNKCLWNIHQQNIPWGKIISLLSKKNLSFHHSIQCKFIHHIYRCKKKYQKVSKDTQFKPRSLVHGEYRIRMFVHRHLCDYNDKIDLTLMILIQWEIYVHIDIKSEQMH